MLNVLVTMRFHEAQLGRLREVSPRLRVRRDDPEIATYSRPDVPRHDAHQRIVRHRERARHRARKSWPAPA